jgi:hypothetical protein
MEDNGAWLIQHPQEAAKLQSERLKAEDQPFAPTEPAAEAVPAVEPEKPAEAPKPPEAPVAAATPAVIEEWTGKSPELKAAFDAHPEIKAAVMGMARENEAAKPVLEIVSTKEEAQFAVEHANRLVTLQTNWIMAAEDPDMVGPAFDQTLEMFMERDANGAIVKGADGQPKMAPDYDIFEGKFAAGKVARVGKGFDARIKELQTRLAGNYASDEARTADEAALEQADYSKKAVDYVLELINRPATGGTSLPALPANASPEQVAYHEQLKAERAELDKSKGVQTAESRKAARTALTQEVGRTWSKSVDDHISSHIAQMKERGEYLPDFVLSDKWINPATQKVTGVTDFGARCWINLNNKIFGNPIHRATLADLEAKGAAGKEARLAELNRLTNLYLPKIIQTRVDEIQQGIRGQGKPPAPGTVAPGASAPAGAPRLEPQSGGIVAPKSMNDDQLMTWAREEAAKTENFAMMSTKDKEELIMQAYARKKYGA